MFWLLLPTLIEITFYIIIIIVIIIVIIYFTGGFNNIGKLFDSYPVKPGTIPKQNNDECDGLKNVVSGVKTCTGWKDECNKTIFNTWTGCAVTRDAKQTCIDDKELISGLCYEKCKDGYHKRPGDVISCWKT